MKAIWKLKRKKIARTSLPISEDEVIEEDNVNQPEITNQFVEPRSPIDMELVNNVLVDNPDLEAEEETHVQQHEVVEDKRVNDGVSEPPSTVNVPIAGNVSKKVFFADTSKDPQVAEDVSNEVDQRAGENVSKEVMVSTTSTSISAGTQEAINVLIAGLQTLLCVQRLSVVKSDSLTKTHQSVPDSKIPKKILDNETVILISPFDGFGISYQPPTNLLDEYSKWISKGLLKTHANKYYCSPPNDNLTTQEHMAHGAIVSAFERLIKNIIKGFSIPAGLPWHLVDDVYIPVNSDGNFHWVLVVVALKERLIRVYDSSNGRRIKDLYVEIKKLAMMLSSYLHDSEFFYQTE
ncbi:hypothetical protein KY285_023806 [Solanum tuberosum]|nr:hypothetical protein KY289_024138 [Solanum tuberosum]KAH0676005.1 hypothetical protein KY285_023806 [Solanum tuberosum]